MKKYFIYKITNPKEAFYIGQTQNIKTREKRYKAALCKQQRRIYNSIKKYGWDTHTFEVIQELECTREDIHNLEIYYINLFQSFYGDNPEYGLNLTRGGKGIQGLKWENTPHEFKKERVKRIVSDETRKKQSEARKGKSLNLTNEQRKRRSDNVKNRVITSETCKRISEGKKGWIPTAETIKNMSDAFYRALDKPGSVERRRLLSEKGKEKIGEKNSKAILTETIVLDIIKYLNEGKKEVDIQKLVGVNRKWIAQIKRRKCWTYLTDKYLDDSKLYKRVDIKLTKEQEEQMRIRYSELNNYRAVGREFGVDQKRAMRVINKNNKL